MSRQWVCVFGALALAQWLSSAGAATADVMEPSPVMPGLDRPRDSAGRLSRRSPAARKKPRKLRVLEDS